MRLANVLLNLIGEPELPEIIQIEYRTEFDNKDIFAGICQYNFDTGKLIPIDDDTYTLTDEIYRYEIRQDGDHSLYLVVYY